MEQLKEVERAQHISDKLNLWDVIRTKVFGNCKLKTYRLNPFRDNCFGRKSKNDVRNFDNLHVRGGYLELPETLEGSTEIGSSRRTQANTSARRSEGSPATPARAALGKLKRSGAIRGRRPRVGLVTGHGFHFLESRMVRAYVNSSAFRTGTSSAESSGSGTCNGESSRSAGNTSQAPAPRATKSILRHGSEPRPPLRAVKRVALRPGRASRHRARGLRGVLAPDAERALCGLL
jgi:hypothetical protein